MHKPLRLATIVADKSAAVVGNPAVSELTNNSKTKQSVVMAMPTSAMQAEA